jgi:hypothetical protein
MTVTAHSISRSLLVPAVALAALASGCGSALQQGGDAPVVVVVNALEGASGAEPDEFASVLFSDVVTYVKQTVGGQETLVRTVFADNGRAILTLVPRNAPESSPSGLNSVTFTSYRVSYRRASGSSTPGVDVPAPFETAGTFTVPAQGTATFHFELVRHAAKESAPLAALEFNGQIISAIADVTFFGRDQAGNSVTVTASVAVNFGDFADPE